MLGSLALLVGACLPACEGTSPDVVAAPPPWCRPAHERWSFKLTPSPARPGAVVSFEMSPENRKVVGSRRNLLFGPADSAEPAFRFEWNVQGGSATMRPWSRDQLIPSDGISGVSGTHSVVIPASVRGRQVLCWKALARKGNTRPGFIVGEVVIDPDG